jgi:NagD protein
MKADAYLIDRDGVLRSAEGGSFIPGSMEWMLRLIQSKNPYLIATNHTTSSPEQCALELQSLGFPVMVRHIHSPLTILFDHFQSAPSSRIYARGSSDLLQYLRKQGLNLVNGPEADIVLLGFDRSMGYEALCCAIAAIIDYGASLIALHENKIYRTHDGTLEPGLGAWVRAIEYATGIQAKIIGKPNVAYYSSALERLRADPGQTLMISDDPLGDLVGAKKCGIKTVFVRSGKYPDPSILAQLPEHLRPDLILDSIASLDL